MNRHYLIGGRKPNAPLGFRITDGGIRRRRINYRVSDNFGVGLLNIGCERAVGTVKPRGSDNSAAFMKISDSEGQELARFRIFKIGYLAINLPELELEAFKIKYLAIKI
jgi:hypothetical protein